jgi:hypothetical protein
MSSSPSDLLINADGNITATSFWLLLALPLFYSGKWGWACLSLFLAFGFSVCQAMDSLAKEDRSDIRFNVIHAHDVVVEMKEHIDDPIILQSALQALARKVNKQNKNKSQDYDESELELYSLQAAQIVLNQSPDSDMLIASVLSLLALIAKNPIVRQQMLRNDCLRSALEAMRDSLARAQEQDDSTPSQVQQLSAELVRKGCLWLGALADDSETLATHVVTLGGLEVILQCLDWYRYHEDVNNWGLWALFQLCFGNSHNQSALVQSGGLRIICQSLKCNAADSMEVCRHGIAVLFDTLRHENEDDLLKIAQLRRLAVTAGLHQAVQHCMELHSDSMEVIGMGTELLLSTGFQGDIPTYQPME